MSVVPSCIGIYIMKNAQLFLNLANMMPDAPLCDKVYAPHVARKLPVGTVVEEIPSPIMPAKDVTVNFYTCAKAIDVTRVSRLMSPHMWLQKIRGYAYVRGQFEGMPHNSCSTIYVRASTLPPYYDSLVFKLTLSKSHHGYEVKTSVISEVRYCCKS
jgi:hypothetical protein